MITLIAIAVAMLAGLIVSRPARALKLPAVTAYLVAGVLIGPFCLGRIGIEGLGFTSESEISALGVISNAALGFIAFSIGNEFRLSQLKATGKQATVIGIVQAVVATIVVDIALIIFHFCAPDKLSLPAAITLGAIAAATAPAATLMVVRQYKAKGKLTDLLLPIVALDDAVGLVVFAISFGIARALQSGVVDMVTILAEPIIEIVGSLMLGTLMGVLLTFVERFFHSRSKRMSLCIVFVFLTVGLSMMEFEIGGIHIGFSSLLVCMMLGTIFCNLCQTSEELMDRTDGWTTPLFIMFFVMSGAELDLAVFRDPIVVLIGVVFLLTRALGKWGGAYMSSSWVHCDDNIRKYLGVTLLPQAGVALGMSVTAMELGSDGALIRSIVLFSVLVLEIVGPMLTKIALTKAGDIREGATNARTVNELPHHKAAAK
ncbi:MAG: cation:proton antiporter [Clostridiaceae bacterium]|nr:cation:proton antiporter [Clostridiaceae bacterium]